MRVAGIIAEYNPFHNGHQLHVEKTRALSGCDYVIAVMSGALTQRGETALCDKWLRARMALNAGVDLVLELPALFAVRPAPQFALGGVSLLGALNTVDVLSFGCEMEDITQLTRMAKCLQAEPPELTAGIRAGLSQGLSHAKARGMALAKMLGVSPECVNAPNTVLALEYMRANAQLIEPMEILPVKRDGAYHSTELAPITSASAVRLGVYKDQWDEVSKSIPAFSLDTIKEQHAQSGISCMEALDDILLYRLRNLTAEQLAQLPDVSEGLEMRVKRYADTAISRQDLLEKIKCKRYTMARIARILMYAMLGIDRYLCDQYGNGAPYARVLGFRDSARPLLRYLNANAEIPIVSDTAELKADACFALEKRATDLWGLSTKNEAYRIAGRDFTEKLWIEMEKP